MNIKIEDFKANDWIKIWAGQWSFLTCSYWGERYTKNYIINGKVFLHKTIFFFNEGKSSCFITQSDRDEFGQNLAKEWIEKPGRAEEVITDFRKRTDDILNFISNNENKDITQEVYTSFWEIQDLYYKPHINIKFVTDYLPKDFLEKILHELDSARTRAEPVFKKTEEFMNKFAEIIGKKVEYPAKLILHLTRNELEDYFTNKSIPSQEQLEKRFNKSSILFCDGTSLVATNDGVQQVEEIVFTETKSESLKGMTAFGGKVQGIVRIILDPTKAQSFKEGDILVTGMTRPEYLPLMNKAAAFITDAGGILSHAAIVARELKKPCVIGTKIATKVLKDGDLVEVDADMGIVKIM